MPNCAGESGRIDVCLSMYTALCISTIRRADWRRRRTDGVGGECGWKSAMANRICCFAPLASLSISPRLFLRFARCRIPGIWRIRSFLIRRNWLTATSCLTMFAGIRRPLFALRRLRKRCLRRSTHIRRNRFSSRISPFGRARMRLGRTGPGNFSRRRACPANSLRFIRQGFCRTRIIGCY